MLGFFPFPFSDFLSYYLSMNEEIFSQISRVGQKVVFKNTTQLFDEGDSCQGMLFVKSGTIKVIKISEDGKEALLYRVNPESLCILSLSCLLGRHNYNAVGIAESDIEGYYVPYGEFNNLLKQSELFREFIFNHFASRISEFIQKIDEIIFKSLKERLKILFENQPASRLRTHQELAVELGTSREVVSRIIAKL